jgi:ATP-dependent Lon protease
MNRRKVIEKVNNSIKNTMIGDNDESMQFIKDKTNYIQEIIRNSIIAIKHYKKCYIFSNSDILLAINILNDLYEKTKRVLDSLTSREFVQEKSIDLLQKIIDKLSMVICGFGTNHIEDLLFICYGSDYIDVNAFSPCIKEKYELIKKYVRPIGYKILQWKQPQTNKTSGLCCNKISEPLFTLENANIFECFDVETTVISFHQKIYGIRIAIPNENNNRTLIIHGIVEDIHLECFSNMYITTRKIEMFIHAENTLKPDEVEIVKKIIDTSTLKDILIFGNDDVIQKLLNIITETHIIKNNKLEITIKRFLEMDIYNQRNMMIQLLLYSKDDDIQYICYLLYDLLSINSGETADSSEQSLLYDSLPWKLKIYFKDVIKYTMNVTNDMHQKYDINRVTLEQQIYLMKSDDIIKEKAILKLKEIKGKSDESCLKVKQYLEGLLKIPFGIYREEPVLKKMNEYNQMFIKLVGNYGELLKLNEICIPIKKQYTNIEIFKYIKVIKKILTENATKVTKNALKNTTGKQLSKLINTINEDNDVKIPKNILKDAKMKAIHDYLEISENKNEDLIKIHDLLQSGSQTMLSKPINEIKFLEGNMNIIKTNMDTIVNTLEESIYSHDHAKNQILKIIGQWINGKQTGYSFGFEGSPGIGKTSLAKKGLANCLMDDNGCTRPFAFIALGGSSNGSTFEGHGYTYVNSTWGRIVDILMESKCMNPIIYIDELDKVSKTENGKEIIGILTHLIDQTQNDTFQDKYFTGINIDLSKVLFIFSYNDPEQIDKILLDRIHRIKFDNLSLADKLVIAGKYILPEINNKMGFDNVIKISDTVMEHIIEKYTLEPGVRKLKEVLFDLYGEINIELLKCKDAEDIDLPINITTELLDEKYLKEYHKVSIVEIHKKPEIGVMNGLWANALGKGGVIPIQTLFFPTSTFLELKLTGLQGDVMKESMNVARTLAWNMTSREVQESWKTYFEDTKCQGLHIHCPEGAVSKDGPSAGAAITTSIYSLLNKTPIKNDVAITGEINLQGEITAIGGLESKILGGIKAGVKVFLFPSKNKQDFDKFFESYGKKGIVNGIKFIDVSHISNVFEHAF